jgi:hypothetical protein
LATQLFLELVSQVAGRVVGLSRALSATIIPQAVQTLSQIFLGFPTPLKFLNSSSVAALI